MGDFSGAVTANETWERNMPAHTQTDFLTLFRGRRDCCRALRTLTRRQQEAIEAEDYTRLLALLAQKQRVLGTLEALKLRHPGLGDQWRRQRDGLGASLRSACDELLDETEALMADVLDRERDCTVELTRRRDETQQRLRDVSAGTHIHHAYRETQVGATHRHIDVGR